MLDWVIQNKTWLFSGILVAIPIALAGWLLSKKKGDRNVDQRTKGEQSPAVNTKGKVEIHYGGK